MPGAPDPNFNLALVLLARGRLDDALQAVRTGLPQRDNWQAHAILGYALDRQGKPDEAVTAFERALELHDDPSTRLLLAKLQFRRKDLTAASDNLNKAMQQGLVGDMTALYERKLRAATARLGEALQTIARDNPQAVSVAGPTAPAVVSSSDPINIGIVVDLESDGGTGGLDLVQAATLAIEKTNRSGGIDGRLLKLVIANGGGSAERYAAEIRRLLVDEGVAAVIDGAVTQRRGVADGTFFVEGVPWMVPAFTADEVLSSPTLNASWLVADRMPAELWGQRVVRSMTEKGTAGGLTVLCENGPRYVPLAQALEAEAKSNGIDVRTVYLATDRDDYLAGLERRFALRVTIIASPRVGAALCRTVRAEAAADTPLYLSPDMLAPAFFAMTGSAADGALFAAPPYAHGGTADKQPFAGAFITMFRRFPTPAAASTYDLTVLLSMALRRAKQDRRKLYDGLTRAATLDGVCGPRRRVGPALAMQHLEMLTLRGGRLVPLSP